MGLTLSQTSRRTAGRVAGRRGARFLCVSGAALLVASALACNRVDMGTVGGTENASAEDEVDEPFVWPSDPENPILSLQVETPDGQGQIVIELMPKLAPTTVAQVVELAEGGYYDGTTFHRVIPGFMIQGGDPNSRDRNPSNDGQGNPDLILGDEFGRAPFLRGVVGMGNKGRRNSTGGQFFIMHADNESLNGRYTAIGRVVSGMQTVDQIAEVAVDKIGRWGPKDRPVENVLMSRVEVETPSPRQTAQTSAAH